MESTNTEIWHGSLIKRAGSETTKAVPIESPKKSKRNASSFSGECKTRRHQMDKELKEPIAEDLEESSVIKLPSMPVLAEADSMQDNFLEMRVKRKSKKSKKSKKHSKRDKTPEKGQLDEVIDPIDTEAEIVQVDTKEEDESNVQQFQDIVRNTLIAVSNSLDDVEQIPNDAHHLVSEKRKPRHHHHHHHHQHLHQHLQNHQHQHQHHHHHHHHRHKHHHHHHQHHQHHQHHHGDDFTMNGNLVHTTLPSSSSTLFSSTTMANNSKSPHCFNQKKRILEQWRREHSQPLQEQQEQEQQQQVPSDSD